jgi:hypothetical protein
VVNVNFLMLEVIVVLANAGIAVAAAARRPMHASRAARGQFAAARRAGLVAINLIAGRPVSALRELLGDHQGRPADLRRLPFHLRRQLRCDRS